MVDLLVNAADLLVERTLETRFGVWEEFLFRYSNADIIVTGYGDWRQSESSLVRIHSTCFAAHYLWSRECDCREQLDLAFERIRDMGAGLIVFLEQDGRANGHAAIMRASLYGREKGCTQSEAYTALGYPSDARSFHGAGIALLKLGVSSVHLMTNNPEKVSALANLGIAVVPSPLIALNEESTHLRRYYEHKKREGHMLGLMAPSPKEHE